MRVHVESPACLLQSGVFEHCSGRCRMGTCQFDKLRADWRSHERQTLLFRVQFLIVHRRRVLFAQSAPIKLQQTVLILVAATLAV